MIELINKKNSRYDSELINIINKSVSDLVKETILCHLINEHICMNCDDFYKEIKLKPTRCYSSLNLVLSDVIRDTSPNMEDTRWWKDKRFNYLVKLEENTDCFLLGLYVSLYDSENFFHSFNRMFDRYTNFNGIVYEETILTNEAEDLFSAFVRKYSMHILLILSGNKINLDNKNKDGYIKKMSKTEKNIYEALIKYLKEDLDELKEDLAGDAIISDSFIKDDPPDVIDMQKEKRLIGKEINKDKEMLFKYIDDRLSEDKKTNAKSKKKNTLHSK